MEITRRNHLAALGSALLAATPLAAAASAQDGQHDDDGTVLYGHGLVWNRALPGVAGALKLAFDLRVNLETGIGFGTAHDPVFPDWNVHFSIGFAERTRLRRGELQLVLKGVVTEGNGGFGIGMPVRILAQTSGDATAIAIAIGDQAFAGAGLVVLAIIAVLIAPLIPSVLKL